MSQKDEKLKDLIRQFSAEFLQRESNGTSMITVTDVRLSSDGKTSDILITVLPDDKQKAALEFARRQVGELREYLLEKIRIGRLPFFNIALDRGEKHRQRIDEITR
ncbi:MAG: ribosome-binding factor A [bacterium]